VVLLVVGLIHLVDSIDSGGIPVFSFDFPAFAQCIRAMGNGNILNYNRDQFVLDYRCFAVVFHEFAFSLHTYVQTRVVEFIYYAAVLELLGSNNSNVCCGATALG